jgi:25S rRNA (uracil2634-N3)-methyltransferase
MIINQKNALNAIRILDLEIQTINLRINCLNFLLNNKEFVENKLKLSPENAKKYDIVERINKGSTLLVGEGNLSFSVSLMKQVCVLENVTTSTYEHSEEISETTRSNARLLKKIGIKVMHHIDATKLKTAFNEHSFDTIIFQFPHSGSREFMIGLNSNYTLVQNFIKSARDVLKKGGVILLTIVDNEFYNNIFRLKEVAKRLSLQNPTKYEFDPKDYPEYTHTMTHKEGSAIDSYHTFATWEFKP